MSLRTRWLLAGVGLVLALAALMALAYVLRPVEYRRDQQPLAPTLLVPPHSDVWERLSL